MDIVKENSSDKINKRMIDEFADKNFLERSTQKSKNISRKIRIKYNYGYAEFSGEGLDKKEYYAHSKINSLSDINQNESLKDISILPTNDNKIFDTFMVNDDNIIDGIDAFDRCIDAEFKILNEIAINIGDNSNIAGKITIYTQLDCCPSCVNVIKQFSRKYPNIKIEIIYQKSWW